MAGVTFFDTKEYEWADISVLIAGASVTKLLGVKYKRTQAKTALKGAGRKTIGIQSGNEDITGSIILYGGAVDDMNKAAVAAGGSSILDVATDIVITYKPAPGRPLQTDTLIGVEFTEYEKGMDQGADHMPVTMPFLAVDLK